MQPKSWSSGRKACHRGQTIKRHWLEKYWTRYATSRHGMIAYISHNDWHVADRNTERLADVVRWRRVEFTITANVRAYSTWRELVHVSTVVFKGVDGGIDRSIIAVVVIGRTGGSGWWYWWLLPNGDNNSFSNLTAWSHPCAMNTSPFFSTPMHLRALHYRNTMVDDDNNQPPNGLTAMDSLDARWSMT